VSLAECLHEAMNLPTSVVITGCDSMEILEQPLCAAGSFRPMTPKSVEALRATIARAVDAGQFERYKTTPDFDSTIAHRRLLG
jgi:hypothetical protein